ncbi:MAG: ribonuclease P protein component [Prevotella sp.]|nr:ribonuclease P protein component [Prevotella sp.]
MALTSTFVFMLELSNKNTFTKEEKLCSTKAIDTLFSVGESFVAYPLRVVYVIHDEFEFDRQNVSVMISVSKRKFKRAVKRNRVKRLIREAYRLNKQGLITLLNRQNKGMDIAFLYLKDELPEFAEIEKSILKAMSILTDKMEKER